MVKKKHCFFCDDLGCPRCGVMKQGSLTEDEVELFEARRDLIAQGKVIKSLIAENGRLKLELENLQNKAGK